MSVNEKMTAIADAIRDKTGGKEVLTLDDMANEIPNVYQSGKAAQHREYWEKALNYGNKQSYLYMFCGSNMTDDVFNPPEGLILKASSFQQVFRYTDKLKNINITLDVSEATNMTNALYGCSKLEKIHKIISSENTPWAANNFQAAYVLAEIRFEGTIGVAFDIHWTTRLSRNSLLSILNVCNKENAGVTIALPKKCVDGNTETETYIANDTELSTALTNATNNGYTITYS